MKTIIGVILIVAGILILNVLTSQSYNEAQHDKNKFLDNCMYNGGCNGVEFYSFR